MKTNKKCATGIKMTGIDCSWLDEDNQESYAQTS